MDIESDAELRLHVINMLEKVDSIDSIKLIPIPSGGNNRVFRVNNGKNDYLLKVYFHHASDTRDRLGNEYRFISFAWQNNVHYIPQPISCDRSNFLGIYEFIKGRKFDLDEVGDNHIAQAIDFFIQVNTKKNELTAKKLPAASEACFSIREHIQCVERRIELLRQIKGNDELTNEATEFIHQYLYPAWENKRKEIEKLAYEQPNQIPLHERCLSPSDFGFHNAIIEENNTVRFIDFEYAGWDDPAKMVCDFFCQVAVPVPLHYFFMFRNAVAEKFADSDSLRERIDFLFPLYQLKWCCIIMNDFLTAGNARRIFADPSDHHTRKKIQLEKARLYFSKITKD